jgi:pimeloyl-ACP methyl ester carboxylesterase
MIDAMPTFAAPDGTVLAYRLLGTGDPLICLPGGPMQASAYLGELGGLSSHRQLVMLDARGTGQSAVPTDAGSYRCDRQVGDVEALRKHLGLKRFDLLAHSAGANLAVLYAAEHPHRLGKLALITPSTRAVGIEVTGQSRIDIARLRSGEPWFGGAFTALEAIVAGDATDESWHAIDPFYYGRWDAAAQEHQAARDSQQNQEAAAIFGSEGAFSQDRVRAALAAFSAPVLVLAGETDPNTPPGVAAELAELFPHAELVVQPGGGHFPWMDDPERFLATTSTFLG